MAPATEIHISATEDDPVVRAQSVIRRGQQELLAGLRAKLALLGELELAADASESARATLVDFCTDELRRHLAATDHVLYATASGAAELRLLVRALRTGHRVLAEHIDALAAAGDMPSVLLAARSIEAVLAAHLEMEQVVFLPALADLPGAYLPGLVEDRDTLLAGGQLDRPEVLDVREIPHGQRHPRIFARYARLAPGEGFVLVNHHNPKPLRREFEAAHPGAFTWDYLEEGPDLWRIRIGRVAVDA